MTNPETSQHTEAEQRVRGRALFAVETVAAGVAVHTVFLSEDNRLFNGPAVFPDAGYALSQIEELRQQVLQHFARAAQVGAQVLAAQTRQQNGESVEGAAAVSVPEMSDSK